MILMQIISNNNCVYKLTRFIALKFSKETLSIKKIIKMPRSVNSVAAKARRKKVLKEAKGYFGRRKNVYTVAFVNF